MDRERGRKTTEGEFVPLVRPWSQTEKNRSPKIGEIHKRERYIFLPDYVLAIAFGLNELDASNLNHLLGRVRTPGPRVNTIMPEEIADADTMKANDPVIGIIRGNKIRVTEVKSLRRVVSFAKFSARMCCGAQRVIMIPAH